VVFPGFDKYDKAHTGVTREIVDIEMACNGGSIIETKKAEGKWQVVKNSKYARRITALETEMAISGPAAGVLIETRRAASVLGETPMDRPEDVEPNPFNGRVYVMLTNNKRKPDQVDPVNPRPANVWGHVLELTPMDGDHAAITFSSDILLKAGNPAEDAVAAMWNPATSENGWFSCPDNCAVDHQGRLWVSTDQGKAWKKASGAPTGSGRWKRAVSDGVRARCSSASLWAPRCAGHASPRTTRPCSWPSNNRPRTVPRTSRASSAVPPSRTRPPGGRTSIPKCRRARPWWSSPRTTAG
jgi:secreted PhoX family phosphatase